LDSLVIHATHISHHLLKTKLASLFTSLPAYENLLCAIIIQSCDAKQLSGFQGMYLAIAKFSVLFEVFESDPFFAVEVFIDLAFA